MSNTNNVLPPSKGLGEETVIQFDDGTGKKFDALVHHPRALSCGAVLHVATKDRATVNKLPGVALAFDVQMPDGSIRVAQFVTTARLMQQLGAALSARYGIL